MGNRWFGRLAILAVVLLGGLAGASVQAENCVSLLSLFQQGKSDAEVAHLTGLPQNDVGACRRELSQPLGVSPAGVPPAGAAGAPPLRAPGAPPIRAGGVAPRRAAGAPPVGAAGAPPAGAAGPPPVGRDVKRLP